MGYLNWLLALTMFCAGVVFMGVMSLWLVPYLMVKFEYTRSTAALVSGLAFISSGVGSIVIGIVSKKVTRRKLFLFEGNTETATAFINMGLVLSGAVGQLIIGELLDIHWKNRADHEMDGDLRVYTVEDFNFALVIVPVSLGIMFVTELFLRETFSKNLEYEPKEKKMPKMEKVKTMEDNDIDVEKDGSADKDSYKTNSNSQEMTSLNNESAEDEDDYH